MAVAVAMPGAKLREGPKAAEMAVGNLAAPPSPTEQQRAAMVEDGKEEDGMT